MLELKGVHHHRPVTPTLKSKESLHNWGCGVRATWRLASAKGIKVKIFQRNVLSVSLRFEKGSCAVQNVLKWLGLSNPPTSALGEAGTNSHTWIRLYNLKQAFLEEKKPGFLNILVRMLLS